MVIVLSIYIHPIYEFCYVIESTPKKKKRFMLLSIIYAYSKFLLFKISKVERKSTHIQNGVSQSPRLWTCFFSYFYQVLH